MTRENAFDIMLKIKGRIKRDADTAVAMGTGARPNPEGPLGMEGSWGTLSRPCLGPSCCREKDPSPQDCPPPHPRPLALRLAPTPALPPGHLPGETPHPARWDTVPLGPSAPAHTCSAPSPAKCLRVHLLTTHGLIVSLPQKYLSAGRR